MHRRNPTVVLIALLIAALWTAPGRAAPASQWRQGWGLATPPPRATVADTADPAMARLQLRGSQPHYQAWAENLLAGPVQVQLRPRTPTSVDSTPALPLQVTLAAGSRRVLAQLRAGGSGEPARLDLVLDTVPGDPRARADDHLYLLPFDAARIRVHQGFGGRFSHQDPQNRYALDFALPEGTPVLAARTGTVMQLRDGSDGDGSFIRLLHQDGSMSVYAHLQAGSAQVKPGQRVAAGQHIALSGDTGHSTAPHLHFALQINAGMRLQSIRFRMQSTQGELHLPQIDPVEVPEHGG